MKNIDNKPQNGARQLYKPRVSEHIQEAKALLNDLEQQIYDGYCKVILISKTPITSTENLEKITHARMMQEAKQSYIYKVR